MTINSKGKVIQLHRNSDMEIEQYEDVTPYPAPLQEDYVPLDSFRSMDVGNGRRVSCKFLEAALQMPDSANILRQDLRYMAFSRYAKEPRDFEAFSWMQDVDMPEVEYLRDASVGVIPRANSGTPAPQMITDFEGGTIIANKLHRGLFTFPMDLFRFDQIGKIRQITDEMGRAAALTMMSHIYTYLTTTGNYTRNSTTNDNDFGANTQTLTWNADSLRTAVGIVSTAKDRKSGTYLMYSADTIICTTSLEVPVLQLLTTTALSRVGGPTTAEAIGTGAINILGSRINKIIVTPWLGQGNTSYAWAAVDSSVNGFTVQTVEPFDVFAEPANASSENWFKTDSLAYLVRGFFGYGFVDDRAWFFSNSTTDATVS